MEEEGEGECGSFFDGFQVFFGDFLGLKRRSEQKQSTSTKTVPLN